MWEVFISKPKICCSINCFTSEFKYFYHCLYTRGLLRLQFNSRVQDTLWPLVEFVPGCSWFNFSAALVNSRMVLLRPVGILNSCVVLCFVSLALKSPDEGAVIYVCIYVCTIWTKFNEMLIVLKIGLLWFVQQKLVSTRLIMTSVPSHWSFVSPVFLFL